MELEEKLSKLKPREFAGSETYNRFGFQIAVAIELILKLADNQEEFIALMDHLDDVVIINDTDSSNKTIFFYQVKSHNKNHITINTVLKEEWLDKMYYNIKALQSYENKAILMTNTGISFGKNEYVEDLELVSLEEYLNKIQNTDLQDKIIKQIAESNNVSEDEVLLNKMYIQKTVLVLDDYDNQLKGKLHEFAVKLYPNLTAISIDTIFNKIKIELDKKQKNKFNPTIPTLEKLYAQKGFSSKGLRRIISLVNDVQFPKNEDLYKVYETLVPSDKIKNYVLFGKEIEEFKMATIKTSSTTLELCFNILDESPLMATIKNEEFIEKLGQCLLNDKNVNRKDYVINYNEYIISLYAFKRLNGGKR